MQGTGKRRRLIAGDERGSSLIEFAVTLPVLMMLVLGIGRFGVAFNNYIALTDAVRAGERQLATNRGQVTNPCQSATNRVFSAAPTLTRTSLGVRVAINGSSYGTSCNNLALSAGQDATVSGTYPCQLTIFGIDFAPRCTLSSSTTGRIE